MSKREIVLNALFERLSTLDVSVKRNDPLPQKIPDGGLVISYQTHKGSLLLATKSICQNRNVPFQALAALNALMISKGPKTPNSAKW